MVESALSKTIQGILLMNSVSTENSIVYHGDVLEVLRQLPANSVDICVTSPPYYGLRSYLPKDHADKAKEIGLEKSLSEYVNRLVGVFREVRRVLKNHGTLWLNLGDSYLESGKGGGGSYERDGMTHSSKAGRTGKGTTHSQLMGIPWRVAFALQDDGWLLRSDISLIKLSAMPESVAGWRWMKCRVKIKPRAKAIDNQEWASHTGQSPRTGGFPIDPAIWSDCPGCDKCEANGGYVLRKGKWRPTRSHEHLFLLAKSDKYFCDGESVKTTPKQATVMRGKYSRVLDDKDEQFAVRHDHETICAGANMRDWMFWVPSPTSEKHYAAFPQFLPSVCIEAGTSSKGCCSVCGMPIVRVLKPTKETEENQVKARNGQDWYARNRDNSNKLGLDKSGEKEYIYGGSLYKTTSWRPSCDCNASTVSAIVLDPFAGTSTTGVVAIKKGRKFIGIDLSEEYVKISHKRLKQAELKRGFF